MSINTLHRGDDDDDDDDSNNKNNNNNMPMCYVGGSHSGVNECWAMPICIQLPTFIKNVVPLKHTCLPVNTA